MREKAPSPCDCIELDTNIVERGIRPIVLNRKNALFAGHDEGAENWACVASLIETCKLNDVEPQAYIADVLDKLVNLWPASRIDELMPWAWPKAHAVHRTRGLTRSLKVNLPTPWDVKTAYRWRARIFFERDVVAVEKAPDHRRRHFLASRTLQTDADFVERKVRLAPMKAKQKIRVRLDPP